MIQRDEEKHLAEEPTILLDQVISTEEPSSDTPGGAPVQTAGTGTGASDSDPADSEMMSAAPAAPDDPVSDSAVPVSTDPVGTVPSVPLQESIPSEGSEVVEETAAGSAGLEQPETAAPSDALSSAETVPSAETAAPEAAETEAAETEASGTESAGTEDAGTEDAPSSPWPRPVSDPDTGEEALPAFVDPEASELAGSGGGHGTPPDDDDSDAEEPEEERPMTLLEHLGELRRRLVRSFLGIAVGFLICYGFAKELFYYLSLPLLAVMPPDAKFIYTGVAEGFFVDLKVSLVAGVFLSCPFIFYQIWAFIAPGLYDEEKKYIVPLAFCSALFFLGGAVFCYFVVFPFAFEFFMSYSTENIVAMLSISEYLGFALKMLIAFGLIFEMPLFSFFLARMGLVTADRMRSVRKYAVLAVFIIAAILTPPDVFSQLMMAGPMLILYEISILVAAAFGRRKPKPEKKDEEEAA